MAACLPACVMESIYSTHHVSAVMICLQTLFMRLFTFSNAGCQTARGGQGRESAAGAPEAGVLICLYVQVRVCICVVCCMCVCVFVVYMCVCAHVVCTCAFIVSQNGMSAAHYSFTFLSHLHTNTTQAVSQQKVSAAAADAGRETDGDECSTPNLSALQVPGEKEKEVRDCVFFNSSKVLEIIIR